MDIVNHYLAKATVFALGFKHESLDGSKYFRSENGSPLCQSKASVTTGLKQTSGSIKSAITLDSRLFRSCALGLIVCALCIIAWVEPSFAQTLDTIDKAASNIDGWLGGTIAKTVAGIAVAAVGYACLAKLIYPVLHAIGYALQVWDHCFIDICFLRFRKGWKIRNVNFWQGNSYHA